MSNSWIGNFKIYKPVTPGRRHKRHPTRFHLHTGDPISRLTKGKRSTGGRNNQGRITVRGRGGGHKRLYRLVDFHRKVPGPHSVIRLEYDPNRSADLALLRNESTNEFSYIIAADDLVPGDTVHSYRNAALPTAVSKVQVLKPGNVLNLKDIPVGTVIHNISLKADAKMALCRSAGTHAQVCAMHSCCFPF